MFALPLVRQKRHFAGILDRGGDLPLLLDRQTGDVAGADVAAFGDEHPQRRGVLVVEDAEPEAGEKIFFARLGSGCGRAGGFFPVTSSPSVRRVMPCMCQLANPDSRKAEFAQIPAQKPVARVAVPQARRASVAWLTCQLAQRLSPLLVRSRR